MPKKHHPRPVDDFTVDDSEWSLDIEHRHQVAGFSPVSREVLQRRYWQLLRFLQQRGMTTRIVVTAQSSVVEGTKLRNSDLTDEGFYFVQRFHSRWINRTGKDGGEANEEAFLSRCYEQLLLEYGNA